MFQRYNKPDSRKLLLLSGGGLSQDGTFDVQKGKRNYVYASMGENDSDTYRIAKLKDETLMHYRLEVPPRGSKEQQKDSFLSDAVTSSHGAGSTMVVVGDKVVEDFPGVINALQFARDAVYFELDQFYSRSYYLVFEKGGAEANRQREMQVHDDTCLGVVLNLIREAIEVDNNQKDAMAKSYAQVNIEMYGPISATQLDFNKGLGDDLRERGFPVDPKDYIVRVNSRKDLAFVKVGKGDGFGQTYILPAKDELSDLIESAFSGDFVKQFYPYGFK